MSLPTPLIPRQTMPFARPAFSDILDAVKFVLDRNYPARGEVVDI